MITAKVVNLDGGYDSERKRARECLQVGEVYEVEHISVGGSHTSIDLVDLGGFNSIYFEFFEDGEPLDIFSDRRFNPYL